MRRTLYLLASSGSKAVKNSTKSTRNYRGSKSSSGKSFPVKSNSSKSEWKFTPRTFRANPKEQVVVHATNVPSIFTCNENTSVNVMKFDGAAKQLFSHKAVYVSPIQLNYQLPDNSVPEFAFIGRSNVGKSTLIATLLGDPQLVRTSKLPGCTKNVNYFAFLCPGADVTPKGSNIKDHELYLIDLPGYGFAGVSKDIREKWKEMIDGYVMNRSFQILRRVYLLIDSRHGVKNSDVEMMLRLNKAGTPYEIILTKMDLSTPSEQKEALASCFANIMASRMSSALPYVHCVSSADGRGLNALKASIMEVCSFDWDNSSQSSANKLEVEEEEEENEDISDDFKQFSELEEEEEEEEEVDDDDHENDDDSDYEEDQGEELDVEYEESEDEEKSNAGEDMDEEDENDDRELSKDDLKIQRILENSSPYLANLGVTESHGLALRAIRANSDEEERYLRRKKEMKLRKHIENKVVE